MDENEFISTLHELHRLNSVYDTVRSYLHVKNQRNEANDEAANFARQFLRAVHSEYVRKSDLLRAATGLVLPNRSATCEPLL